MTVTNYGFYGNNFFSRAASLEYPANRGYEHMVRGGLWVGAVARDTAGEFTGVTSGTVDAAQGPTSPEGSEWTPGDRQILRRSTLAPSPFYDRARAVSELDMIADFNDFSPTRAASNNENHRSMKLEVRHENYQWNYAEFKNLLFFHIKVTNRGPLLKNAWVGIYTELTSGNKGGYVNWPPSSTDPGGLGGWFNKKWISYDSTLNMLREHYCASPPVPPSEPNGCHLERAPYWIGLRYLGSRGLTGDSTRRHLTLSAWSWSPGNAFRDEDRERYQLMSTGLIQSLDGDTLLPVSGDPVEIFAVGPFPLVYKDSSVTVDFAMVGGTEVPDLNHNSGFAQFAFDHDYILPRPPDPPRVAVVARDTALDIYWDDESEDAYDVTSPNPRDFEGYRVYIGEDPDTLARVAQFDVAGDTASFNTGLPARTDTTIAITGSPGDSLHANYRLSVGGLRNGFKYYCAVTGFDLGNTQITPLESGVTEINRRVAVPGPAPEERPEQRPTVFPNPYRVEARWDQGRNVRDHYLWFANLPERCTLKIFTLAGDLVFEKEFDGAAYHGEGSRGIYDPTLSLGKPTLSRTTFGWNLITTDGQAIATGIYLFSVEAKGSKRHVGKFLVVKSDREGQ
jgi:hypothetical protein